MIMNRHPFTASELAGAPWKKSSYSGSSEGQCVEIADLTGTFHDEVAIRDSKDPDGPALLFGPQAFADFLTAVKLDPRFGL